MKGEISYLSESPIKDTEYFERFFSDIDQASVSVKWRFDEQQADWFNHGFTSHEFFRRLRRLLRTIEEEMATAQNKAAHAELNRLKKDITDSE